MTPTVDQVRLAVDRQCHFWNERRQTDWAALFAPDGLVRSVRASFTPVAEVHTEYFAGDQPSQPGPAEPSTAVDPRR